MNIKRNKSLVLMSLVILVFCVSGCTYIERETFIIATEDGQKIRLTCPVVKSNRSELSYVTSGYCVVEPKQ